MFLKEERREGGRRDGGEKGEGKEVILIINCVPIIMLTTQPLYYTLINDTYTHVLMHKLQQTD